MNKIHFSLETTHDAPSFFQRLDFFAHDREAAERFAEKTAAHFGTSLVLVDPTRVAEGKMRSRIEYDPATPSHARTHRVTRDHGARS